MYDKVETPLPGETNFRPAVASILAELRSPRPAIPFRRTEYYSAVVDLRELTGHDTMLHFQSRKGRNKGNHKLELLDCGEKGYEEMLELIAGVITEHPLPLQISRLDCCADVDEVGVDWFHASVRAQWKQWQAKIGKIDVEFSEMGKRKLQTMYLGKRPNCHRIYDKVAESEHRYAYLARQHKKRLRERYYSELASRENEEIPAEVMARLEADFPMPDFETVFGFARNHVRTRVERQMGAGRVPRELNKIYKLLDGPKFNPFSNLRFVGGGSVMVSPDDYSPADWCAGMYMYSVLRSGEMSWHELRMLLNRDCNGARYEKKFRPFLDAASSGIVSITSEQLFERYRESVRRQLAA